MIDMTSDLLSEERPTFEQLLKLLEANDMHRRTRHSRRPAATAAYSMRFD